MSASFSKEGAKVTCGEAGRHHDYAKRIHLIKNPENNNDYDLNTNLKLNDTELVPRKRATLSNIQLNSILYNRNNPPEQKNKYFSYQTYKKIR